MRNVKDIKSLALGLADEADPAFVWLTEEERKAKPELQNVEALRLFTTKTGKTLVCLITDRKAYVKSLFGAEEETGRLS